MFIICEGYKALAPQIVHQLHTSEKQHSNSRGININYPDKHFTNNSNLSRVKPDSGRLLGVLSDSEAKYAII